MAEQSTRSILQHVSSKEKSELCRFLFFGVIKLSGDEVLNIFGEYARENFADRVTGLMLVYPNYMIHLLESTEEEIFKACSCLIHFEPKILGVSKYFPMEIYVSDERFFQKWYGRKAIDKLDSGDEFEDIDLENFDQITSTYASVMKSLYALYQELRDAKTKSHSCLMERLEQLGNKGNCHLPEVKILKALAESSWGESLEKIVDIYWNGISSKEIDDEIWPFPENQCPPVETINNI